MPLSKLENWMFYEVPDELIAQKPAVPAESARLMVLRKSAGTVEHHYVRDLSKILDASYIVLVNNTKVIDCKLVGAWKENGREQVFYVMAKLPDKNRKLDAVEADDLFQISGEGLEPSDVEVNAQIELANEDRSLVVTGTLLKHINDGSCDAIMSFDCSEQMLRQFYGVPLPPYINKPESKDYEDRYQTIFAKNSADESLGLGAVAAPTAGLHFTDGVVAELKAKGVEIVETTLHVGYGTFAHVHAKDLKDHKMHAESYEMSEDTADRLSDAKNKDGKKILSVGTTSTRTLETVATKMKVERSSGSLDEHIGKEYVNVRPGKGSTDIFIRPGYEWQACDALLTNFHMPGLTPIMLVSAFAGHELTQRAYKEALELKYRFFSFGDAMLILP